MLIKPCIITAIFAKNTVVAFVKPIGSLLVRNSAIYPSHHKRRFYLQELLSANRGNETVGNNKHMAIQSPESLSSPEIVNGAVGNEKHMAIQSPESLSSSEIVKFAIPATGIWLCGPLLSLIDTSVVGLFSGTIQQAALNPAVAITDYGGLLVAFMNTATLGLVAAARSSDRDTEGGPETQKTLITALRLALIVGILFGLTLGFLAPILVSLLLGVKAEDHQLILSATRYVRIRALGMPAAVVIATAQSACLGMKDVASPLVVMILAGFVNFFGDMLFVPMRNSFFGGSAGAACATSLSQYIALLVFIQWLTSKPKLNGAEKRVSRGILCKDFNVWSLFKVPNSSDMKDFFPFVIPVTTTAIGRVSGYIAMSHVVSSTLSTVDMAAQQIILAFFLVLTPVCDSLNLTAQSFMPAVFEQNNVKDPLKRVAAMRKMIRNFIKVGAGCGVILFALVSALPVVGYLFTQDVLVQQSMKTAIPFVGLFFLLSGIVCAGEGLLLGQKDLQFLGRAYTAYFFAVPHFLLRLKKVPLLLESQQGIRAMWKIFFIYQSIRMSTWLTRLCYLLMREEKDAFSNSIIVDK